MGGSSVKKWESLFVGNMFGFEMSEFRKRKTWGDVLLLMGTHCVLEAFSYLDCKLKYLTQTSPLTTISRGYFYPSYGYKLQKFLYFRSEFLDAFKLHIFNGLVSKPFYFV